MFFWGKTDYRNGNWGHYFNINIYVLVFKLSFPLVKLWNMLIGFETIKNIGYPPNLFFIILSSTKCFSGPKSERVKSGTRVCFIFNYVGAFYCF